jgi:hypothetical protein
MESIRGNKFMDIYRIRLKRFPHLFIGKKDPSYALKSDYALKQWGYSNETADQRLQLDAHWYKPEKYAKVWTSLSALKRFLTLCRRNGADTFSEYELLNGEEVVDINEL